MFLETIVLLAAIPAGFLIAYLAKDELIVGRKWFVILMMLSSLVGIILYFFGFFSGALTSAFILIFTATSFWKSFDENWTKVN